jgi:septal ring factor EnvC (AmiA/AmiB activator)
MLTNRSAFLLFFLIALVHQTVIGQSRDELEKRRKQIQGEIELLQKQQSSISKDKKASLGQLNLIQSKLQKRFAVIENINDEVRLIDNNIYSSNREIYRLEKQLDTLKEHYGRTIEYAYKNRSSYDMLNFIFTSSGFNDAVKRVAYLKSYRKYREDQVANISRTKAELERKKNQLSQNKQEKNKALEEQNKQKQILEEEKNEKAGFVNKLKAREKELLKELDAKKRLDKNLQNAIAAIVRREIEDARKKAAAEEAKRVALENAAKAKAANESGAVKAPATTTTAPKPAATVRKTTVLESTPEVTRVSVGFENNRRNLPWPVEVGTITSGFGKRSIEGTKLMEDNIGVTIGTQQGATVKAVFEGVVSSVFDVAGSQAVTIKHGKYFTTYYNLSSVSVSKGTQVTMGQLIGRAGVNDDGDGEILFVVNNESTFVDPQGWLKSR